MNRKLRTLLCLTLSLLLLCGLCACGEEEEAGTATNPMTPEEYDPEQSYHVVRDDEGTYNFWVADYLGNTFFYREGERFQPEFTKLTDSVLQITVPFANNPSQRWAVFCDVHTQKVSASFGNFLAAKGSKVACIELLTEQYHVFVKDIFDSAAQPTVTTLTGLEVNKDGGLYEKAELTEGGALEIVYDTKDGKKTVLIDLN